MLAAAFSIKQKHIQYRTVRPCAIHCQKRSRCFRKIHCKESYTHCRMWLLSSLLRWCTKTGFELWHFTMEGWRCRGCYNQLQIYIAKESYDLSRKNDHYLWGLTAGAYAAQELNRGNVSLRGKILCDLPCSLPLMIRVRVLKNSEKCTTHPIVQYFPACENNKNIYGML